MSQFKRSREELPRVAQSQPRALRIMLLSLITLCGVAMIFITISDPRVIRTIGFSGEYVSSDESRNDNLGKAAPVLLLGLSDRDKEKRTSENSSAQSTAAFKIQRLSAEHMPRDRIPVRRGGIVGDK